MNSNREKKNFRVPNNFAEIEIFIINDFIEGVYGVNISTHFEKFTFFTILSIYDFHRREQRRTQSRALRNTPM